MLTQQTLKELVVYCPERGGLFWIKNRRKAKAGNRIGSKTQEGYRQTSLFLKQYKEHRLIWLYHYGNFPLKELDHLNGIRDDNRIENLRECVEGKNQQNIRKPNITNKNGFLGVYPSSKRWMARITSNGKSIYLGSFDTKEEAHLAYIQAKRQYHPFGEL